MGEGAVRNPMSGRLTPKAAQSRSDIICWDKGWLLNERVDLRFLSADSNDPPLPVDGEGKRLTLPWLANKADGCIAANIVLPAAAPRNFLRVTLDIARPFLWIGFVDTDGRYFCFCQDSIRQSDTREAVKRQLGFAGCIDRL